MSVWLDACAGVMPPRSRRAHDTELPAQAIPSWRPQPWTPALEGVRPVLAQPRARPAHRCAGRRDLRTRRGAGARGPRQAWGRGEGLDPDPGPGTPRSSSDPASSLAAPRNELAGATGAPAELNLGRARGCDWAGGIVVATGQSRLGEPTLRLIVSLKLTPSPARLADPLDTLPHLGRTTNLRSATAAAAAHRSQGQARSTLPRAASTQSGLVSSDPRLARSTTAGESVSTATARSRVQPHQVQLPHVARGVTTAQSLRHHEVKGSTESA